MGVQRRETYNLERDRHYTEIKDLHCWPQDKVGFQSRQINVLDLADDGPPPSTFCNGHKCKEQCKAYSFMSMFRSCRREENLLTGANISWSKATLFMAGKVACLFVIGKVLDRNPNHWN